MAPRTRGSIQKLAAINAAASQETMLDDTTTKKPFDDSITNNKLPENDKYQRTTPTRAKSTTTNNKSTQLFGRKSKLAKIDLSTFLSDDKVWNALTDEQKQILKSACSSTCTWGKNSSEQPTMGLLLYDMHWKSDVRIFEENLKDGYYEPAWIEEAKEATSERLDGTFDDWKLNKFEQYWGQKMEEHDQEELRGKQHVSLTDLVIAQHLQAGDNWLYSRSFGKGKKTITVESKFEMSGLDDYGKAEFKIELPSRLVSAEKRLASEMLDDDEDVTTTGRTKRVRLSEQHISHDLDIVPEDDLRKSVGPGDDTENLTEPIQSRRSGRRLSSKQITTNIPNENTQNGLIKSILKKTSMTLASLKANSVEDLETQLLSYDGRGQKPGRADSWKYFGVCRGGQDIGSLYNIRQEFLHKQTIQGKRTNDNDDG